MRLGDSNSKNVSVEEHEYFERLLTRICLLVGENEKITNITGYAPYWTNTNLLKFVNNSHQIPFDSHLNVALVAPVCHAHLLLSGHPLADMKLAQANEVLFLDPKLLVDKSALIAARFDEIPNALFDS